MEYFSVLNLKKTTEKLDEVKSTFFLDLNLDQIIERIEDEWGEEIKELYYQLPDSEECEDYRRAVYQDVKREEIFIVLHNFLQKMRKREEIIATKEAVEEKMQKHVWQIREIFIYCHGIEELLENLGKLGCKSEGLISLIKLLQNYTSSDSFKQMKKSADAIMEELSGYRILLTYEKDRFSVAVGAGVADYEGFLTECFPEHEPYLKSPFLAEPDLTELEYEVVKIFKKKHGPFFTKAADFYKQYEEYAEENILRLYKEIRFYLSFRVLQKKLEERGLVFAMPRKAEKKEMKATGLYDLALAIVGLDENRKVVSNNMNYFDGEQFFVVTGPNQGGKTTFARSLGQLVYFSKIGLEVPALDATVPYFREILTHFSVEESVESGKGKLMDELARLLPMMEETMENAFVVINELFTTAANYDATIMGKKVLDYFIEHHCMGIYVTHLTELAQKREKVVSLRATVNEQKVQTFIIERSEATEEAGAGIQVKKYKLTYEQIKERFS